MKEFKLNPTRRILVPTDFSPNAYGAIQYAAMLASRLGSKLILFHSVNVVVPAGMLPPLAVPEFQQMQDLKEKLRGVQGALAASFPMLDTEISTATGFAVEEIIGLCTAKKADLIVMGTKGAHGLGEMLIGSNTADVIAKASCPVLAVPGNTVSREIRKIIFATNYSDHDFQSIFLLTEMFRPWNPEIIVVHADDGSRTTEEYRQFEWFKSQVMTSISYEPFQFNLIEGKNTEQAISDFARQAGANIISVSTRRRSLFERLTTRSTSKQLAYHTDIPLLAFHADDSEGLTPFLKPR